MRRLVLCRWPTYAITPKPTISPPPWPPPTPRMNAFPRSYGPEIAPIEGYLSLVYTTIIEIFFIWLVLRRRPSFAAAQQPTILRRPWPPRHPYGALSMELLPQYCAHISFSSSIFTLLCWIFQIWTISWMEALYRSFLISRISYQRTM